MSGSDMNGQFIGVMGQRAHESDGCDVACVAAGTVVQLADPWSAMHNEAKES